jgi:hypothetical protein
VSERIIEVFGELSRYVGVAEPRRFVHHSCLEGGQLRTYWEPTLGNKVSLGKLGCWCQGGLGFDLVRGYDGDLGFGGGCCVPYQRSSCCLRG